MKIRLPGRDSPVGLRVVPSYESGMQTTHDWNTNAITRSAAVAALLSSSLYCHANYVFDWLPLDGNAATGSIEISDAAHAAGSFGLSDIVRFEFVEPPALPASVGFTWDMVTSATGTLSIDGLSIASLTLAANTSTVVDAFHYLTVVPYPTSYENSHLLTANNIVGRQIFLGGWGHGHQVDNPVPDAGSSLTLLGSALAGLGLLRCKRTSS